MTTATSSKAPTDEEVRHLAELLEWGSNGAPWEYDSDALARSAYAQWVGWMSPAYVVGLLDRFSAITKQITELEDKFHKLDGTTRILLISRLVQDGHASDWKAAVKMVRDDFRGVLSLYSGEDQK